MVPMFTISMIQWMTQTAQTATQRVACRHCTYDVSTVIFFQLGVNIVIAVVSSFGSKAI